MDVAILEFSMKGFEETYWENSSYKKLDFKGLTLDFSEIFEGSVFYKPTNDGEVGKRIGKTVAEKSMIFEVSL